MLFCNSLKQLRLSVFTQNKFVNLRPALPSLRNIERETERGREREIETERGRERERETEREGERGSRSWREN